MTNKDNKKKQDPQTTGHSWDGIEEYNTPAPRWWLVVWGISIIWGIVYWLFFPTWPTIKDHSKGISNWSSKSALIDSQSEIRDRQNTYLKEFRSSSFKEILKNEKLVRFALNGGKVAFKENCAACHGTGAGGLEGFPNLNDDDWLWGGKIDDIYQTIRFGIRSGHENSRDSEMPAFGKDDILTKGQILDVVEHVRSLSDLGKKNKDGEKIFIENCAVCHGRNAKGDRSVGAPNLTDAIWLYGSNIDDMTKTISYSRQGVMPNWNERLSDDTIRQLTIYIHSLGGGEF